jgi:hypothetical protein
MVFFIFILLLMFSLSGVLYLMVRALPRMTMARAAGVNAGGGTRAASSDGSETGDSFSSAATGSPKNFLDRWANSKLPEKIDAVFNDWLLKFLRKFKVVTLKLDNMISQHLRKIRHEHETADKKAAIDFKEIAEKKDEK